MEENTEEAQSGEKIAAIVMLCGCIVFILYINLREYLNRGEIQENHGQTIGWIVRYFDLHGSEAGTGRRITYSYKVGNRTYTREVYTAVKFPECDDTEPSTACLKKRFWVIFSQDDTTKSLINFYQEIQDESNPPFRESIDQFQ